MMDWKGGNNGRLRPRGSEKVGQPSDEAHYQHELPEAGGFGGVEYLNAAITGQSNANSDVAGRRLPGGRQATART